MISFLSSVPFCKWQAAAKGGSIWPQSNSKAVKTADTGKVAISMEKNLGKLTVAAAGLAGAGAAVVLAKKASQAKKVGMRRRAWIAAGWIISWNRS